ADRENKDDDSHALHYRFSHRRDNPYLDGVSYYATNPIPADAARAAITNNRARFRKARHGRWRNLFQIQRSRRGEKVVSRAPGPRDRQVWHQLRIPPGRRSGEEGISSMVAVQ